MSKVGWLTPSEEKFFGKLIADELPLKGVLGMATKWVAPMLIKGADNKWADKVPEPWQTHLETLTTMLYDAAQDNVITVEERVAIREYCVTVMNTSIDIPYLDEEDEAVTFLKGWEFIASLIYKWAGKDESDSIEL